VSERETLTRDVRTNEARRSGYERARHHVLLTRSGHHLLPGSDRSADVLARRGRSVSTARIAAPGRPVTTDSRKNRKPVANAVSGSTCSLPRKLTKNASRSAMPLIVNGTSITRNSIGPRTKYGRGESSTPHALPTSQIAPTRKTCTTSVSAKAPTS